MKKKIIFYTICIIIGYISTNAIAETISFADGNTEITTETNKEKPQNADNHDDKNIGSQTKDIIVETKEKQELVKNEKNTDKINNNEEKNKTNALIKENTTEQKKKDNNEEKNKKEPTDKINEIDEKKKNGTETQQKSPTTGLETSDIIIDEKLTDNQTKIKNNDPFLNLTPIKDSELGKLLTKFDMVKALDYDYNKITFSNAEFLENVDEFKIVKQMIVEQNHPEIKKQREEEEAKKLSLAEELKKSLAVRPFEGIKLTSLLFFNENDWRCRVNGEILTQNKKTTKDKQISVLKTNKTSVVFIIKRTTPNMIKKTAEIINKRYPYFQNYFTIKEKNKTYIGCKLFVGQKLDFDTMKISG